MTNITPGPANRGSGSPPDALGQQRPVPAEQAFGVVKGEPIGQTGSLKYQVTGLNAVKLDRQKLAQYVGQHPDAYLHEIAKHFDCTPAAVCYALKQMGMTRKKRPPLTKSKTRPK